MTLSHGWQGCSAELSSKEEGIRLESHHKCVRRETGVVDSTCDAVETRAMGPYGLREDRAILMFPKIQNKTTTNCFQDSMQNSHV